ncbi:MAG TPA: hypothetical protein VGM82_05025 [Gemmatimonadaceae bacterium]|jgi:hypothetical protein
MNKLALATLGTTVIVLAACSDSTTGTTASDSNTTLMPSSMATVYSATPVGFDELSTSFNASGTEGAFLPDFDSRGRGRGPGGGDDRDHGGPGFGLGLMGGGMGGFLIGDGLLNDHFLNFRSGKCAFQANVGVVCADTSHSGTVVSSKTLKYTTASGTLQQSIDSTTDAIELTAAMKGSNTRRDSSSSSVDASSHQKVTGLTGASRTVNSQSQGMETSTGNSLFGTFTSKRVTADTLVGVVIPKKTSTTTKVYPTAGTITRTMSATVNIQSATLVTNRREVITYDGTATAKVVITKDGVTQNCTLPLPRGSLTCS